MIHHHYDLFIYCSCRAKSGPVQPGPSLPSVPTFCGRSWPSRTCDAFHLPAQVVGIGLHGRRISSAPGRRYFLPFDAVVSWNFTRTSCCVCAHHISPSLLSVFRSLWLRSFVSCLSADLARCGNQSPTKRLENTSRARKERNQRFEPGKPFRATAQEQKRSRQI